MSSDLSIQRPSTVKCANLIRQNKWRYALISHEDSKEASSQQQPQFILSVKATTTNAKQEPNRFFLANNTDILSLDGQALIDSPKTHESSFIGRVWVDRRYTTQTSFLYTILGRPADFATSGGFPNEEQGACEIGFVHFDTTDGFVQMGGINGKMTVAFPKTVTKESQQLVRFDPSSFTGSSKKPPQSLYDCYLLDRSRFVTLDPKNPFWHEQTQSFQLNFSGRIRLASVKNFMLADSEHQDEIPPMFRFGRRNKPTLQDPVEEYCCDFRSPLNALVAVGIALAIFDGKEQPPNGTAPLLDESQGGGFGPLAPDSQHNSAQVPHLPENLVFPPNSNKHHHQQQQQHVSVTAISQQGGGGGGGPGSLSGTSNTKWLEDMQRELELEDETIAWLNKARVTEKNFVQLQKDDLTGLALMQGRVLLREVEFRKQNPGKTSWGGTTSEAAAYVARSLAGVPSASSFQGESQVIGPSSPGDLLSNVQAPSGGPNQRVFTSASLSQKQDEIKVAFAKYKRQIYDNQEVQIDFSTSLGGGGFGQVHPALIDNNRRVAAKLFKSFSDGIKEALLMLELGAEFSNVIVKIEGVAAIQRVPDQRFQLQPGFTKLDPPEFCMLMEWATDRSLNDKLKERAAQLPTQDIVRYALQIAEALSFIHRRKPRSCLHLDLKPGNILVFGGGTLLKLCDFGISKATEHEMTLVSYAGRGTPIYMPPEQMTTRNVTAKLDIYAYGVILFWLITGRQPQEAAEEEKYSWNSMTPGEIANASKHIRQCMSQKVREWARKESPEFFIDICVKCLSLNPNERPLDGFVLLQELLAPCVNHEISRSMEFVLTMLKKHQLVPDEAICIDSKIAEEALTKSVAFIADAESYYEEYED